jgi:transketolase N-terminal domain/subunit
MFCKVVYLFYFHLACPVLYAAWHEAGLLSHDEVMRLRKIDSDLEGKHNGAKII